ncbi:MAG: 2-amino-4-hydroxy-6-hydroxymethyldihydropteridine diphosphokinase [Steroidobacteraceae bacterium]
MHPIIWRPAYVALGSNLDDPRRQVERAFDALARLADTRLVSRSGLWRSAPMGPKHQPEFINAVAGLLTRRDPHALLQDLRGLERRMGKVEPAIRWGPRVIDLDLLMVGEARCDEPGLQLPHPGMHQRNFVLYPLAEIAPSLWIPDRGRVCRVLEGVPGDGIERLAARNSGA